MGQVADMGGWYGSIQNAVFPEGHGKIVVRVVIVEPFVERACSIQDRVVEQEAPAGKVDTDKVAGAVSGVGWKGAGRSVGGSRVNGAETEQLGVFAVGIQQSGGPAGVEEDVVVGEEDPVGVAAFVAVVVEAVEVEGFVRDKDFYASVVTPALLLPVGIGLHQHHSEINVGFRCTEAANGFLVHPENLFVQGVGEYDDIDPQSGFQVRQLSGKFPIPLPFSCLENLGKPWFARGKE